MTKKNNAENSLLRSALPALKRAAMNTRKEAIFHNTKLIVCRDNKIVKLSAGDLRKEIFINEKNNN